jgi:hypothetical protein
MHNEPQMIKDLLVLLFALDKLDSLRSIPRLSVAVCADKPVRANSNVPGPRKAHDMRTKAKVLTIEYLRRGVALHDALIHRSRVGPFPLPLFLSEWLVVYLRKDEQLVLMLPLDAEAIQLLLQTATQERLEAIFVIEASSEERLRSEPFDGLRAGLKSISVS